MDTSLPAEIAERRRRLGQRHRLAPNAKSNSVAEIAQSMVGLHSSDPATVFLSVRARMPEPTIAAVEEALYLERTVARVLGMRRTMFVVPIELVPILDQGVVAAMVDRERRRLAGYIEGAGIAGDGSKWVDRVKNETTKALRARGTAIAAELKADVPELGEKIVFGEGKKWGGAVGVSTRILFLLATEGTIVRARPRGSWLSSQYRWALRDEWVSGQPAIPTPADARRDLLSAWLRSYGPGSLTDIRWWTGWTKAYAVEALHKLETTVVGDAAEPLYALAGDDEETPATPEWASLLPALDPTPMGWKEREWYLGGHTKALFDRNGNIGPTIWLNGRIVGGWAVTAPDDVTIAMLEPATSDQERLILAEVSSVVEFLEGAVVIPRFRTPLEKRLLA